MPSMLGPAIATIAVLVHTAVPVRSQTAAAQPLLPVDPVTGIVDAFRDHDIVALPDAHGNAESHAFRLALIRDPRFAASVDDIVIELGNSRHQQVADRYVRGEKVSTGDLRKIWQDTTVTTAANNYVMIRELLDAVRAVNASRKSSRWLRVLLADPPIDWKRVSDESGYRKYFAFRQSHPAAVVVTEVLAKRRKALLLYGALHLQRRNIQANYDMAAWEVQTPVSLIQRATPARIFVIWEAGVETLGETARHWTWPRLATVAGTTLGSADFATLLPLRLAEQRGTFVGGKFVAIAPGEFRRVAAAEQVDAVLFLGPRTPDRPSHEVPRELCRQPGWLTEQLRRMEITVPRFEAERLKEYCATR